MHLAVDTVQTKAKVVKLLPNYDGDVDLKDVEGRTARQRVKERVSRQFKGILQSFNP